MKKMPRRDGTRSLIEARLNQGPLGRPPSGRSPLTLPGSAAILAACGLEARTPGGRAGARSTHLTAAG